MTEGYRIPDEPLKFIQGRVRERKVIWTYHVNMRMRSRSISRAEIIGAVKTYEVIESYPDDKYFPSYLVYGKHEQQVFHVFFAVDVEGSNVRIVTAYRPRLEDWQSDLRTRRR